MVNEMPPRLQQLFDLFERDKDMSIIGIYERFMGLPPAQTGRPRSADTLRGRRRAQQYMGRYITQLNRRLKRRQLKVKPGLLKETYRLVSTR